MRRLSAPPPPFYKPRPVMPPGGMPGQKKLPPDIQKLIDDAIKEYAQKQGGQAAAGSGSSGTAAAGGGAAAASQVGGSSVVANEAANAAFNEAAGIASQNSFNAGANAAGEGANAAWNAGATEAGGGLSEAAPSVFGNFSEMGLGPQAGVIAGTASTIKGLSDVAKGKKDNSLMGKINRFHAGNATGGISEVVSKFGGSHGKGKAQKGQDKNRRFGKEKGVYDDKYWYTRLDGKRINMGNQHDDVTGKLTSDIDWDDENAVSLVALLDPLSEYIGEGDETRRARQTGEFVNALKDAKDPRAEIRALYEKFGVNADTFKDFTHGEKGRADVYRKNVNEIFGNNQNFSGQMEKPGTPPPIKITGGQGPGHWEDSKGNRVTGIDPGFNINNRWVPDNPKFAGPSSRIDNMNQVFDGVLTKGPARINPNPVYSPNQNNSNDITRMMDPNTTWQAASSFLQMPKAPASIKPANNPNSPGFKDGKRITYPTKRK